MGGIKIVIEAINIISLFSGIGAFEKALTKSNIPYEVIAFCDSDEACRKSYKLLHNSKNAKEYSFIQDINFYELYEELCKNTGKSIDLITFGSPCTNFSTASNKVNGKGCVWKCPSCKKKFNPIKDYPDLLQGESNLYFNCPTCKSIINPLDKNIYTYDKESINESGFLYYALKSVEIIKPKTIMFENIPTLLEDWKDIFGDTFRETFQYTRDILEKMNYQLYTFKLNAKYFGIPQDRERVYTLGILKTEKKLIEVLKNRINFYSNELDFDDSNGLCIYKNKDIDIYNFIPLTAFIERSMEEDKIKKAYNLTRKPVCIGEVYSNAELESFYKEHEDSNQAVETHLISRKQVNVGEVARKSFNKSANIYSLSGVIPTLEAASGKGGNNMFKILYYPSHVIRALSALEYMRLMGFDNHDYEVLRQSGVSQTNIYRMCGNSIVVPVLEFLFKLIYSPESNDNSTII